MTSTGRRALWVGLALAVLVIIFLMTREPTAHPASEVREETQVERAYPHLKAPEKAPAALESLSRETAVKRPPAPGGALVTFVAAESREPVVWAHWRIDRHGQAVAEGTADAKGAALLTADDVNAWEQSRLRVWADGRRDEHVPMPADARGGTVEVLLDKFHVDFAGMVLDDAGRPIEGAGVVILYWNHTASWFNYADDLFRTTTDAEGAFRLSAKVWHPDIQGIDGHVLWAGAPGFVPAHRKPNKRGEDGLVLRLERDFNGGVVEVRALRPDGTPASDAELWIEGVPPGDAARQFAELWRDPTDARPAGAATWVTIGERETWWRRFDADGRCMLGPLPPGMRRLQVLSGDGAADLRVNVVPGPTATRVQVLLKPLRTAAGFLRVAQDPGWQCEHEAHKHVVLYEGWPEPPEARSIDSGDFQLTDLPPRVASMTIVTEGHPQVVVALPPEGDVSLGEVLIPTSRIVDGTLSWPKGHKPEAWSGVRVVDREGTVTEASTFYTSGGGARFRLILPRRPAPDAWIVVRPRKSDGDPTTDVRIDGPFDFTSGRSLHLTLPVAARED